MGLLCGLSLCAAGTPLARAAADKPQAPEARAQAASRLFEQAEARFARAEYEAALALFRQAMAVEPHDVLLFNMAVCLERLGRLNEAKETYAAAAGSQQLDEHARERAREAAKQLSAPPLPSPGAQAEQPARRETSQQAQIFGPLGWAGLAVTGAGAIAATALWLAADDNSAKFDDAIQREDIPAARLYLNRGDTFDVWYKISLTLGLVGAAAIVVDSFWLQPHNRRVRAEAGGLSFRF